jgi:predicted transcriptional regulator
MVKVTFTLDDATVKQIRDSAARLNQPQSAIVREAVKQYSQRNGKMSEEERVRRLALFDALVPLIRKRPQREVEAELAEIRRARGHGWRGYPKPR